VPGSDHYTNVSAYTEAGYDGKLYRIINESRVDVTSESEYNVSVSDGRIEWTVPQLSEDVYEVELTILTVQSYPMVGGYWEVAFNTTGVADLAITAEDDTTFSEVGVDDYSSYDDLRFIDVSPYDGEWYYLVENNTYEVLEEEVVFSYENETSELIGNFSVVENGTNSTDKSSFQLENVNNSENLNNSTQEFTTTTTTATTTSTIKKEEKHGFKQNLTNAPDLYQVVPHGLNNSNINEYLNVSVESKAGLAESGQSRQTYDLVVPHGQQGFKAFLSESPLPGAQIENTITLNNRTYLLLNSSQVEGNSYRIKGIYFPDFNSSSTSIEKSYVMTEGKHTLLFRFGDQEEYAYNYAWSNTSYNYSQRIDMVNNASAALSAGTTVAVTANTRELYDAGKILASGDDLRVYYNDSSATELKRYLSPQNGTTIATSNVTQIYFRLQADIAGGAADNNYYLYYGNDTAISEYANPEDAYDADGVTVLLSCLFRGDTTCAGSEVGAITGTQRYSVGSSLWFGGNDYVNLSSSGFSNTSGTIEFWMMKDDWSDSRNETLFSVGSDISSDIEGLVGLWRLDNETAAENGSYVADASGNGDLEVVTTDDNSISSVSGKFGNALDFDGSHDYLRQKVYDRQTGTVSTNATHIMDSGQDFTEWIDTSSMSYYMIVAENGTDTGWGYLGGLSNTTDIAVYNAKSDGSNAWLGTRPTTGTITYEIRKTDYQIAGYFTVGAWVKVDTITSPRTIMEKSRGKQFVLISGYNSNGDIAFQVGNGVAVDVNGVIQANVWYHVVGKYVGGWEYLYLNGELIGSKSLDGTYAVGSGKLYIGMDSENDAHSYYFFNGKIDESFILNRSMSDEEVRRLYLGGLSAHKNEDRLEVNLGNTTLSYDVSTFTGWNQITGTYNSTAAVLYINGTEVNSSAGFGPVSNITEVMNIGAAWNSTGNKWWLNGTLDEVKVHNRTLTNTEILETYQRGLANLPSNASTTGLQLYLPLDESGNATTAHDVSGQGNDGTLYGHPFPLTYEIRSTDYQITEAITFGAWVKPDSLGNYAVFSKHNGLWAAGGALSSYYMQLKVNGSVYVRVLTTDGLSDIYSTTTYSPNNWYFLTVSYDRANVKLYVNGKME